MKIKPIFRKKYVWTWICLVCFYLIRLITLIGKRVGISENRILKKSYYISPILYFLLLCLIGPILEEFIFRYLVFKIVNKKFKRFWLTCFVSFFTFIFSHLRVWENFSRYFPWLAFYSIAFIFIYWLSEYNLFFPIILHILINTTYAVFYICQQ